MECQNPEICSAKHKRWKRNQKKFIPIGEKEHEMFIKNFKKGEGELIYSDHCLKRCYERAISRSDIDDVLEYGWVIERTQIGYMQDVYLTILGYTMRKRPLHVVVFVDTSEEWTVVTTYTPRNDLAKWSNDYQERICFCNKDEWMNWV